MPTHPIEMLEGRTIEQKTLADVKRKNRATGGRLWSERG